MEENETQKLISLDNLSYYNSKIQNQISNIHVNAATTSDIENLFSPIVDLYYDLTDGNWVGTNPEYYTLDSDIIDAFSEDVYYAYEGERTFNLTINDGVNEVFGVCTPIDDISATWVSEDEQTTATVAYTEIEEADYEWGIKITYVTVEEGE